MSHQVHHDRNLLYIIIVTSPVHMKVYMCTNDNNNSVLIEIKLDSVRLTRYARRPLPVGATNIGEWYSILNLMGLAAVITNCALVIFVAPSSEYISTSTSTKVHIYASPLSSSLT